MLIGCLLQAILLMLSPAAPDAAVRLMPSSATQPEFPPDIVVMKAAADVRLGYYQGALDRLAGFQATGPQAERLSAAADILRGEALIGVGRHEDALAALAQHKDSPRTVFASVARDHTARALASSGDAEATPVDAVQVNSNFESDCHRLLVESPCDALPVQCEGAERLARLKPADRFRRAEELFECWGYAEAAAEFEHFLTDKRFKSYRNRAHFYLAEIHGRKLRDDRKKAFDHYRHVYKFGGGSKSYSLYQMGRCLMNLEQYDEAAAIFLQYAGKFPKGEFAERCWYYQGWLPYDHDQLEPALKGFDAYLSRYSKGELWSYIVWFKGWSQYRLGRMDDSAKTLKKLAGWGNDIVGAKAAYWLARIAQQTGKTEAAKDAFRKITKRWPLSYYGLLAWRALDSCGGDQDPFLGEHPSLSIPYPSPFEAEEIVPSLASRLDDTMDAVLLGEIELARKSFAPLGADFDTAAADEARARYWIHSLLEQPDVLREWGGRNHRIRGKKPTDDNRLRWMMEFPQAYRLLVEAEAVKSGLPPWFIYSIMRQESRYRRGVVSWADAVGLLQVIPQTGSRTAARLGVPFDRKLLTLPETNIKLGAGYLGALARDFRNQYILVAASYNAGPAPIRTFLGLNKGKDIDFAVEEIAYNEARNYCRKVSGHMLKYLSIYASADEAAQLLPLLVPVKPDFEVGSQVDY